MNDSSHFDTTFEALTGVPPFPWQRALYERFLEGNIPASCNLPTGLGKTSVIAIWLLALAERPGKIPRRLVYVVNRRTVVDQTTDEAEKLRRNLAKLTPRPWFSELALSTLRGQFADNREWSADPSRPAIICGTVDMIGSRLLFSGYGVGFKAKPLHAGFLGQDALLVHDEAHLEPAFQKLIETIACEQRGGRLNDKGVCVIDPKRIPDFKPMQVMELTATTRNNKGLETPSAFTLLPDDRTHPIVKQRIEAAKKLVLTPADDDKQVVETITELAAGYKNANAAVLVFVRSLDAVTAIEKELAKTKRTVVLLTGTMRGRERDDLVKQSGFKRFLKGAEPGETVYLVCTSAGEVGVDISADHMVCDLSTFDSMAQRLGRVNRYGNRTDARIDVVHPASFGRVDKKTGELKAEEMDQRRQKTLALLQQLPALGDGQYDASPLSLSNLDADARLAAFAPTPTILPATDILFDAWALTTIRDKLPGRPPVEPYLHGIADWQPPETHVAWREEVEIITGDLLDRYPPADLLDDYPLKPHELLSDRSDRVFRQLEVLAQRHADRPVWIVDDREGVEVTRLADLADKQQKNRIDGCTILLPPSVGGLSAGMLDGASEQADDVADVAVDEHDRLLRQRAWDEDDVSGHLRLIRTIDTKPDAEDGEADSDSAGRRFWHWYELPSEGGRTSTRPVTWEVHVSDVVKHAKQIVAGLPLPREIADAVILAAELHDHGKRRERFQITLGNREYPKVVLAKSGRKGARLPEPFRHEFASLFDAQTDARLGFLGEELRDIVLHLIAAHHGRARPHFATEEAFDPDRPYHDAEVTAIETVRRFARLQRQYGRWGLAYLESLLRAADWAASAEEAKV